MTCIQLAGEIHRNVLFNDFVSLFGHRRDSDADGIVDQHIQPTIAFHHCFEHPVPVGRHGDICCNGDRSKACRGLFEDLLVARRDPDLGAGVPERLRDSGAVAFRTTGDEYNLVLHELPLAAVTLRRASEATYPDPCRYSLPPAAAS